MQLAVFMCGPGPLISAVRNAAFSAFRLTLIPFTAFAQMIHIGSNQCLFRLIPNPICGLFFNVAGGGTVLSGSLKSGSSEDNESGTLHRSGTDADVYRRSSKKSVTEGGATRTFTAGTCAKPNGDELNAQPQLNLYSARFNLYSV